MSQHSRLSCEADTVDGHNPAIDHPYAWTVASIAPEPIDRSRMVNAPLLYVIIPISSELNFKAAFVTEAQPCHHFFVSPFSLSVRVPLHVKGRMLFDIDSVFVALDEGSEWNSEVGWRLQTHTCVLI